MNNDNTNIAIIGALVLVYIGGDKLFKFIGISKDKADKSLEDYSNNPLSFWNSNYWKSLSKDPKKKVQVLKIATMKKMWNELNNAFGWFNDNEISAISIFKNNIKYKSQLSFFSKFVQDNYNVNLLEWLKGSNYPNDRLDANEISSITNYVKNLKTGLI
jgi:hypothetical protein